MKCYVSLVCFLSVFVFVSSAPFLNGNTGTQLQLGSGNNRNGGGLGGLTNILSQIDLPGLLQGINSFVKLVGAICTPCGQILDNVIQNVTSTAFRVFGRAILQGGGLGGGRSGSGGGGTNSVNVVLPTFPPDEDDEDYEDSETSSGPVETLENSTETITKKPTDQQEDFTPTFSNDESNQIARRHARITRAVANDQVVAESAPEPSADLSDIEDDQDRNKRFLPFGGGSGSGGSGNFLFDIVRNTADRAARMVGTVYRMVAGTQHFGWNPESNTDKQNSDNIAAQSSPAVQLVAGSGATEESDEKANSPDGAEGEVHQKSVDAHYSEGIPGPVTRLLVIANRGIANLIQDLILRLAQTSEKLVNFKARLITSLI